ncbi:hypothetical protein DFA_02236 [Cavenderia fasciculata]|uniref:Fanconi anemia group I protein n=1 Tax=Cavenderia fasciculata TaxID=261658 RepID=F4PYW4_CACFS|nr:uncharacterized protein DFA_02236 [Cavenderia fasciculata]EGG18993.1 hypothetical protein DFA_02236 [Cavenderia fasciculata]|eukprot:XP_004357472.1 hypothetical protein DFA_02236 [Cavenderia fasciculata]
MEIIDHDQDDRIIDAYQEYIQIVASRSRGGGSSSQLDDNANDQDDVNNNNNNIHGGDNQNKERDHLLKLVDQAGEEVVINFYRQRIEQSKLLAPYMKAILLSYTLLPKYIFSIENSPNNNQEEDEMIDDDDDDDNDYDDDQDNKKKKKNKNKKKKKKPPQKSLQSYESEYENIRAHFIIDFIKDISTSQYPLGDESDLTECVVTMNSECDGFKSNHVQGVLTAIQTTFDQNNKAQLLELYPKFLSQAVYLQSCSNNNDSDEIAGFQHNSIISITKPTWKKHLLGGIIQMFNDISLSKSDLTHIVDNTIECLKGLKHTELPEAIYKLTLLSSHGQKGYILGKVVDLLEAKSRSTNENDIVWLSNQAFIAFQVNISVKQDMGLGKEFLKLDHSLSRFDLIFLLSIAAIPRFKSQVIAILKSQLLKYLKNPKHDLKHIMNLANRIKDSEEWNQLVEPFLAFAICLVDTNAMLITEPIRRAREMGRELLEILFGNQLSQSTIMDEIVGRIQTKSDNLHPWFLLLTKLATKEQAFLQKSFSKLKDSLDYIQYYSPSTVRQLITAFNLICRGEGNTSLQDGIIITLKKSMFKKEPEARAAAITGFLQVLKDIPLSTQPKLVYDILGNLRRALSQQASIRSLLYSGLKDLVRSKKYIGNYICEILLFHFQQIYHHKIQPEFFNSFSKAEHGGRVLSEPFDQLVNCIQFCIRNTSRPINNNNNGEQNNPSASNVLDQLTREFDGFVEQMSAITIKSLTLLSPLEIGIVIGVLEALIEYQATSQTPVDNNIINRLILQCRDAQVALNTQKEQSKTKTSPKQSSTKTKKKRKRDQEEEDDDDDDEEENQDESDGGVVDKSAPKKKATDKKLQVKEQPREPLSAYCIIRLFEVIHPILEKSLIKKNPAALTKISKFLNFVYISANSRLKRMFEELKSFKELNIDESKESPFKTGHRECSTIFKYLLNHVNNLEWHSLVIDDDGDKDLSKKPSIQMMILQPMKIIVDYFCFETDSIEPILGLYVNKTPTNEERQVTQLIEQILYHQKMCLDSEIPHQRWDETELLLNIIWVLTNKPSIKKQTLTVMKEFVARLYQQKVNSPALASVITKLCLESNSFKENIVIARDINIFLETPQKQEEEDDEEEESDDQQNNIINIRTHEAVETQLLKFTNDAIDRVDELINTLKKDDKQFTNANEKSCSEMKRILELLVETKLINMKPGTTREKHLKTVKKLFVVLFKHQSAMISKKMNPPRGESEFKKMVHLASLLFSETLNAAKLDQTPQSNNKSKKDSGKQSAFILRESKFIPILTFNLEKYESAVIRYEQKFKTSTLGKYFKKTAVNSLNFADNDDAFKNALSDEDEPKKKKQPTKKSGAVKSPTNKKPAAPKLRKSSPKPKQTQKKPANFRSPTSRKPFNSKSNNNYNSDDDDDDDNDDDN